MRDNSKAVEARTNAAATRIWTEVQERARDQKPPCRCRLRKGMDWDELLAIGEGCTHDFGHYTCPTLDYYRRAVGPPVRDAEVELAL